MGVRYIPSYYLGKEMQWNDNNVDLVGIHVYETSEDSMHVYFKDSAYFCYCAYVLRMSRYLGLLWVVPTNTGIFLRGLKLCGESRT